MKEQVRRLCVLRILELPGYTYKLECGYIVKLGTWKSIGSSWCGYDADSVICEKCSKELDDEIPSSS